MSASPISEILAVPISGITAVNSGVVAAQSECCALITDSRHWAFSAEVEFEIEGIGEHNRVIEVRLEVERGELGIGWWQDEDQRWVALTSAIPNSGRSSIRLHVPAGTLGGKLVFTNWTKGGEPARARVKAVIVEDHGALASTPPHPVLHRYRPFRGTVPAGFSCDWLGVLLEQRLLNPNAQISVSEEFVDAKYPDGIGESLFDLIAVCKSVDRARASFTMFELGAGYGLWLTQGAIAARQRDLKVQLVGVEAEPTHYQMMLRHLQNNGINPEEHEIIEAAVASADGEVFFQVGNPLEWWGQSVLDIPAAEVTPDQVKPVRAVSLQRLLHGYERVNLIHMDVQGVEYDVLRSAIDLADERVETLIIGTHSKQIEKDLRTMLLSHYWIPNCDFTLSEINLTPYGSIPFGDGLQIWENSRLV